MHRFPIVFAVLTASFFAASPGLAQSPFDSIDTPHGRCGLWAAIPGGGDLRRDAAYNRCALDRAPTLLDGVPMPPAPRYGAAIGQFTIIVNPDGTVDPRLTRAWTSGTDTVFHRQALETIRRWRFEPGLRGGTPVRSGFMLHIKSGPRNDTLPSRLEWTYRRGLEEDTLFGTWTTEAPLPPFAPEQVDSIYMAMLRRLVKMKVIVPDVLDRRCLVLESGDSAAHARLTWRAYGVLYSSDVYSSDLRSHPSALAPYGCERSTDAARIVLPRVHRTENGRVVLYPSGDWLPDWPPGFEGRTYRAWSARCVADVPDHGEVSIDCFIMPSLSQRDLGRWERERERKAAAAETDVADIDSLLVTVVAMTRGAYQTDTLHAVLRSLPRLSMAAVRDSVQPCGGWAAYSPQKGSELYVLQGSPSDMELRIVEVRHGPAPRDERTSLLCDPQEPRRADFVAFLLGDLGDRARAPITLCFSNGLRCSTSYVLDPNRHTLAERSHLAFRLSDLREDTRVGDQLVFRIYTDPVPPDLLPLIVFRVNGRWRMWATIPRKVAPDAWEYDTIWGEGYPPDTEVRLYLIER